MSAPASTTGKNLVWKLAEVMKEVGRIPKNGRNNFHNYDYVKEADLVEKLSALLADRHIFITTSTKGVETIELSKAVPKTGEIITQKIGIMRFEFTFHDGESAEKLALDGAGEIDQDGGKGLYKAMTGAMKYFLMKNFLIATGDDPEQSHGVQAPPKNAPTKAAPAKPKVPAAKQQPTPVQAMEHLNACKAVDALDKIYSQLFTYSWPQNEAADISICYLNKYKMLNPTLLFDGTNQVFDAQNKLIATFVAEPTGKLMLQKAAASLTPDDVNATFGTEAAGKIAA